MADLLLNLTIYVVAFIVIWIGSGLIVSSITKLSHKLRIPAFLISFMILGMLTSTPEIAVGLSAVSANSPDIFVGNLLGGIPTLFLLVIPILAILGRGIKLSHSLPQSSIVISLCVSIVPFVAVLDHKVTNPEGVFLILAYLVGVYFLKRDNSANKHNVSLLKLKSYSFLDILKILGGTALVLFSSNIIVSKTIYFSEIFHIAPFYISLIFLSFGTNLPELTLAVRSIISGKKDIAFGDYLGSASANTILFGIFTLMIKEPIIEVDNFLTMFLLVATGLFLFYHFSKTKHTISAKEGLVLLSIYAVFVILEFVTL